MTPLFDPMQVEALAMDDFPHETTARAAAAAEAASLRALLDGKDELLGRLIAERTALEAAKRDAVAECAAQRRRAEAAEAAAEALRDDAASRIAEERRQVSNMCWTASCQQRQLTWQHVLAPSFSPIRSCCLPRMPPIRTGHRA